MNHTPGLTRKPVSPDTFKALMSEFPSGVSVVTTTDEDGRPWGMTCSALCSLSIEPPTLMVCLRADSPTLAAVLRSGRFVANLLHGDGQDVARLFGSGSSRGERFKSVTWTAGPAGPHLSADTHAIADCRVTRTVDGGTHLIVLGEVFDVTRRDGKPPLLYGRRRFHTLPHDTTPTR
ncbi:flavin reductase family protein [Streptomyces roseochromogenus]|uniref:Flavin reductase like domain-containing protein n=1 Tax=Streptomyces roseochromogenus subsp. oscitans DS 12.976 TaxID=1352936 RepID=V6KZA8_STRRC|nr:flavin reductase family protein [Streptomyces roseochromogenus]EST34314.1 hypothetical protein M878_11210 [Streptomyces roseochromogenus subsp. oscitans DS 12.976]